MQHVLHFDHEGLYLTDGRSAFGLYGSGGTGELIARWDYNRNRTKHPVAHIHVGGQAPILEALAVRGVSTRPELERHHFPVGGKRFRPCLEDVIEYAIREGLAEPHDGWRSAIDEHRNVFYQLQLKAAVRRDPESAADALRDGGWSCEPRSEI